MRRHPGRKRPSKAARKFGAENYSWISKAAYRHLMGLGTTAQWAEYTAHLRTCRREAEKFYDQYKARFSREVRRAVWSEVGVRECLEDIRSNAEHAYITSEWWCNVYEFPHSSHPRFQYDAVVSIMDEEVLELIAYLRSKLEKEFPEDVLDLSLDQLVELVESYLAPELARRRR